MPITDFSINPEIARAYTLSADFYLKPEIFEYCREAIFARTWQFAGDCDMLPEPGDTCPYTLLQDFLNEPLVLTRDKEMAIHLLSNVCTHRGNIIAKEPGRTHKLRCRYHGRTFDLNGKLLSMPEFREVENFPCEKDNLVPLPLFKWGKWLFTSLAQLTSPNCFMKDMMERMAWLPVHDFIARPELSQTYNIKAHWALYCENFLEGFHIPFVHNGLNAKIDFTQYTTELFPYSSLQLAIARPGEVSFDLPESSPDFGKQIAAYYFFVFPNMMFNFYPWGLSLNIVEPISPSESRVRFLIYMWKEELFNTGAGSGLETVELEDEEIVEAVQKGIRSRFYNQGRYSVSKEQGIHHFHRVLCDFLNAEKPVVQTGHSQIS